MRTRDKKRIVKMFLRGMSTWEIAVDLWPVLEAERLDIEEIIREHMRSTIGPRGGKKR